MAISYHEFMIATKILHTKFLNLQNVYCEMLMFYFPRPYIKPIFQSIAAKIGSEPCCDWVGPSGSGHFVKMVHNGIEYGDMQLICEAYHLMRNGLGLDNDRMSQVSYMYPSDLVEQ